MNTFAIFLLCAYVLQATLAQYLGATGCAPGAAVATAGFANPGLLAPYGATGYGARFGNYGYGALGAGYGALGAGYGALGAGYGALGGIYGAGLGAPFGLGYGRGLLL